MTSHDRTNTLHLALNKYRESASPFYDEAIEDVMARAAQRGHLGKADIGAIAAWKRLNTSTRWMRDFMSTADSTVREATATARDSALSTDGDIQSAASKARSALSPIPGFRKGDARPGLCRHLLTGTSSHGGIRPPRSSRPPVHRAFTYTETWPLWPLHGSDRTSHRGSRTRWKSTERPRRGPCPLHTWWSCRLTRVIAPRVGRQPIRLAMLS